MSNHTRGYSDFFTSGFRAMTRRVRSSRPASMCIASASFATTSNSTPPSRRHSLRGMTPRGRTTSMVITHPPIESPVTALEHKRRSSIATFSSRMLDRVLSSTSDAPHSRRTDSFLDCGHDPEASVWITAGGPITPSQISIDSRFRDPGFYTIDPFAASPDSKSFFIDLTDTPPELPPSKRESFLSLSSSDHSFSLFRRRERPTSIHTMPLPSRSRRSSFQCRPHSRDKYEQSWILEEESPVSTTFPEEWDDPAHIDWRQFHIELLGDDA
ncbi:hypothetical protein BD779DRAFT_1668390 [Infundibulicybe gibba]|nr:hypothetical protein BD779DRAFT_1668390 [Infundibulicybe gibba]